MELITYILEVILMAYVIYGIKGMINSYKTIFAWKITDYALYIFGLLFIILSLIATW